MAYKFVVYEKDGEIARITLNRPEKLNALSYVWAGEDFAEVVAAAKEADNDDDGKVVIFKGAGRAFSAGQDLSKVGFVYGFSTDKNARRPSQRIRLKLDREGLWDAFQHLWLCRKLTIAQVHGYCLEAGIMLAMTCDFIIATDDAQIGWPGQRLGFAGSGEWSFGPLVYSIGLRRALDLWITGRIISGKEAADIGLVTRAVAPDKLEEEVNALASQLCVYPRDGIAIGKATRHLFYDMFGITGMSHTIGYITHTMFTNLRYEPGEWNFF
ncbi:MAG: enoyl-CoA hydratase/isomerase family protein [Chloroflexota bacterium]